MLDLDHFKRINDTYGHQAGDAVLKEAARRIRLSVRSYDFVGRYGGEEFCIVMPGCSDAQVRKRAEMIRLAVSSEPFRIGAALIPLTVSLGATVVPPTEFSLPAVFSRADVALYHAKASGRNITVHCALRGRLHIRDEVVQHPLRRMPGSILFSVCGAAVGAGCRPAGG